MNRAALHEEFKTIELLTAQSVCTNYNDRILKHPSAVTYFTASKNRYGNILPTEETRVKLTERSGVEGSDYINGNYIFGKLEFISCQAPLQETIADFWRMVWEQGSSVIVMITRFFEGGKKKADLYWPDEGKTALYEEIAVTLRHVFNGEYFVTRVFQLQHGDQSRKVYHFQFMDWPDFGVPQSTKGILKLAKHVRAHQERARLKGRTGPIVVHCSAGVGRSGTFIAVYHLISLSNKGIQPNIMELVLEMRKHRNGMVQTEDQYVFIHRAFDDHLARQRRKLLAEKNKRPTSSRSSADVAVLEPSPKLKRPGMYSRVCKLSYSLNDLEVRESSQLCPTLMDMKMPL